MLIKFTPQREEYNVGHDTKLHCLKKQEEPVHPVFYTSLKKNVLEGALVGGMFRVEHFLLSCYNNITTPVDL